MAEDSSSSAETPSQKVINKIKERLNKEIEDRLDQAPKNEGKVYLGYFGKLSAVSGQSLTIEENGNQKEGTINEETDISSIHYGVKTNIDSEDIKDMLGDFVLIIGTKEDENHISAIKISFFPEPEPSEQRMVLFGQVKEADSLNITINTPGGDKEISIDKNTAISMTGGQKLNNENILIDDYLIVICTLDGEDLTAKKILLSPGHNNPAALENQINASESALATPSAEANE